MEKENKGQGKKCFIITPIGNENSDTFRKAKGVIDSVIKPVLSEYGFDDVKPAYEINVSGMITTQIINRIIEDELVVVNLTGNNPNVMYELCLRHVVAKPIIHICEKGTVLPFDIKDGRTVFYENDMLGVEELKSSLREYLNEIDYSKEYSDNPIYNAKKMNILLKHVPDEDGNAIQITLLQKIYEKLNMNNMVKNNQINYYDNSSKIIQEYSEVYYKVIIEKCKADNLNVLKAKIIDELEKKNYFLEHIQERELYFRNISTRDSNHFRNIINDIEKKFDATIGIMMYKGENGFSI